MGLTKAQKDANAKAGTQQRKDLLLNAVWDSKRLPAPPKGGDNLACIIDVYVGISENSGKVVVDVAEMNDAERRFLVRKARALGFDPKW